jgi:REP element-mobilizing transposase RayT
MMRDDAGSQVSRNERGDPLIDPSDALREFARGAMKGDVIRLDREQARVLLTQFHCTSGVRRWKLLAVAIMANHVHLVVNVHGDPEPEDILRDVKSYGSGALNLQWGRPQSETWWTESGSKRKLDSDNSVIGAIQYVIDQNFPLVIWTKDRGMILPAVGGESC